MSISAKAVAGFGPTAALILCCAAGPATLSTPFDEQAMLWSKQPGTGEIHGQGFLKTRAGDTKTCAGNEVALVPSTPYTDEMARLLDANASSFTNLDARYRVYRRTTRCDAQGKFAFKDLPTGNWIAAVPVRWQMNVSVYGAVQQGGTVWARVTTKPNDLATVLLTR